MGMPYSQVVRQLPDPLQVYVWEGRGYEKLLHYYPQLGSHHPFRALKRFTTFMHEKCKQRLVLGQGQRSLKTPQKNGTYIYVYSLLSHCTCGLYCILASSMYVCQCVRCTWWVLHMFACMCEKRGRPHPLLTYHSCFFPLPLMFIYHLSHFPVTTRIKVLPLYVDHRHR